MAEDRDPAAADPDELPPQTAEPIEVYTTLAAKHGLIRPGDKLDENVVDMLAEMVGLCADIGDGYTNGDDDSNAGEHIRAVYWPGP